MKLNCIAIDDEPLALDIIEDYINKTPFLNLVHRTENAIEALQIVQEGGIDLVFLDIQMPQISGIQFIKLYGDKTNYILTTAYPQYALESYDFNVADYLLKPIAFDRFYKAAEKVYKQTKNEYTKDNKISQNLNPYHHTNNYVFVKAENKIQKIALEDILYIEGLKDYISIYTKTDRKITLQSMKKMEENLPKSQFIRVHKSYIISINKIESIERSRIHIGGNTIPIGETYREDFLNKIEANNL